MDRRADAGSDYVFLNVVPMFHFFFLQAEDGIRDGTVTGVQTCALPIWRVAHDIQGRTAALTQVLEEIIAAHRIVRVFGGEDYERKRARAAANRLRVSMSKESSATALGSPLTQLFAALAVGGVVWVALAQSHAGDFDFAMFLSYLVALITLLDRLKGLSGINAAIQRGLAAAESIFGFLGLEEERDNGTVTLRGARGEIEFRNITLRYESKESEALSD